jgi:outer membrane protein assembly factor BamB
LKVLWTAPVGVGFGGAAVSGGRVYLLDRDEKVGDALRVLDFSTGKGLWRYDNTEADLAEEHLEGLRRERRRA